MKPRAWHNKISNAAQMGGIETAVLDNGAGRGTRIAWFNTGTGLRYKVVIDRAMDIAEAFYYQHSLTWISHLGIAAPQPFSHRGTDWLRTFGGGLLTTCGLTHVGGPETDDQGERGLHGVISNLPAEVESILQPDPARGRMTMGITGRIKQTQIFGPSLELRRTISGTLGQPFLNIHDEVMNVANTPVPHMVLYHFNFGWPLVDEGTGILWRGSWQSPEGNPEEREKKIFREGNNFRRCPPPLDQHSSTGEEVAFINPIPDTDGICTCGLHNSTLGIAVALQWQKEKLPWLTNWQHWGKDEYVTGLEPGTNPPIGQATARRQDQLIQLAPGETRTYDIHFEVLDDETRIREFLKKNNF